ncbi:MAG: carboxypeptidase-like regulatory domain-containing protein [Rhodothermia bacterium]|nr:carboxypeptidase-like regulatory domain-containing protein [Rhodothermia bacterium]
MPKQAVFASILVALTVGQVQAQTIPAVTITGTVTEADTGAPLPGAHVFVASSMIGTTTGQDGTYRLERVPIGALRLYVSMIGYEPEARDMLLRTAAVRVVDFQLKPRVVELGEVVVEAKRDKKWRQRLERFQRLFIGETPNAQETRIMNPEVLDFEASGGEFRALAAQPLIIENRALGYRIQYFLKDFVAEPTRTRYDGEPLYEELEPESEEEAQLWETNRRNAFIGSFRHFLLALLAGRTEEQQFMTYGRTVMGSGSPGEMPGNPTSGTRFPVEAAELFKPGETPNEKTLEFDGFTEIIFKGEYEDESYLEWSRAGRRRLKYQTSWIRLERGPAVFDYKGDVLDPYGVTFYGYLAFERVADEVPKEYRPG